MAVKRKLWPRYVSVGTAPEFPKYPCPTCADGRLVLKEGSYVCHETALSERVREKDNDWEPEWTEERFSAFLECDEKACGEMVVVSGDTAVVPAWDDDYGQVLASVVKPRSMTPAPPLFVLPPSLPKKVVSQLQLAFALYWADRGACVSRLRTSLEAVLDDKGIATTGLDKKNKPYRLSLSQRIELFEKKFGEPDNAESMHALRVIGNLGTHGDEPDGDVLFDAIDVYEDALLEVYEGKTAKLKATKLKLKAMK